MRHDDVQEDTAADEAPQRTALCNKVCGCTLPLWHDGLCDVEFDAAASGAKKRRRCREREADSPAAEPSEREADSPAAEPSEREADSPAAEPSEREADSPAAEPSDSDEAHVVHEEGADVDDEDEDDEEEGEGKVRGLVGGGGDSELVAREAQGTSSDQRPRRGARDGANSAPSSLSSSGMVLRISIPPEHRPMWAARWSEREEVSESDERDEGASMRRAVKRARPR
jgi:hypothetical protein